MSTEITIDMWRDRIGIAEYALKSYYSAVDRFQDYYKGKYTDSMPYDKSGEKLDQVSVNTPYIAIKSTNATIYAKNPEVYCKSRINKKEIGGVEVSGDEIARDATEILNSTIKDIKLKREVKKCLLDSGFGDGVLRIGYSLKTVEIEITPDEYAKMDDANKERIKKIKSNIGKEIPIVDEKIVKENVWVKRWNPKDFIVDPEATSPDLSDARWVCFKKPIEVDDYESYGVKGDLRKAKYNNDAKKYNKNVRGVDWRRPTMYEVWDKENKKRHVFFDISETMMTDDWDYDFFPVELLYFNEFPDFSRGISDILFYEPQLKEKNLIRTQQANHRRRFNRITLYETGAITKDQIDNVKKNVDGSYCEVADVEKIKPAEYPALPNDVYALEDRVDRDINQITQQWEMQRSTQPAKQQTATEASIIDSRSKLGSNEKQDIIEDFLKNVLFKLYVLMRKYYSVEKVSKLIGRPPAEWEKLKKDIFSIKNELEVDIVVSSTMPKENKATEIQQIIQIIGLLVAQQVNPNDPLIKYFEKKVLILMGEKEAENIMNRQIQTMPQPGMGGAVNQNQLAVTPTTSQMAESQGKPML